MMKSIFRFLLITTGLAFTLSSSAHHSFAVYDFETQIPFEGTVDTLNFRNPHISMTFKTTNEQGEEMIIDFIEGAPANMLVRSGLRPAMIEPGTHITAVGSPLISDPTKFFLRAVILENGDEY